MKHTGRIGLTERLKVISTCRVLCYIASDQKRSGGVLCIILVLDSSECTNLDVLTGAYDCCPVPRVRDAIFDSFSMPLREMRIDGT